MDTPNPPEDAAFRIELPAFEGPLDLLLHLVKKHELEIIDLPIAFVTERYLHYLDMMQELDLDVAAEYLVMAATLAHIKSKSLLPSDPREEEEDFDEDYMEDPREELILRLLEYQKYKQAAEQLGERALPGRDVFTRGTPAPTAQGEAPLAEVGLFKLLDAFEGILKRVRGKTGFEITAERISIQERMTQIAELLRQRRQCTFEELFESDRTRYDVVVTFLALLEMTKMHLTKIFQADSDAPIYLKYALLDKDSPTVPPEAVTSDGNQGQPDPSTVPDEVWPGDVSEVEISDEDVDADVDTDDEDVDADVDTDDEDVDTDDEDVDTDDEDVDTDDEDVDTDDEDVDTDDEDVDTDDEDVIMEPGGQAEESDES